MEKFGRQGMQYLVLDILVLELYSSTVLINSGVGTGGSGGSMNRGPSSWGPRVVEPQKKFRQDS